jgi:hypothetical protein
MCKPVELPHGADTRRASFAGFTQVAGSNPSTLERIAHHECRVGPLSADKTDARHLRPTHCCFRARCERLAGRASDDWNGRIASAISWRRLTIARRERELSRGSHRGACLAREPGDPPTWTTVLLSREGRRLGVGQFIGAPDESGSFLVSSEGVRIGPSTFST